MAGSVKVTRERDDTPPKRSLLKLLLSAPRQVFLNWIAKRGYKDEAAALRQAKVDLTPRERLRLLMAIASKNRDQVGEIVASLVAKTPQGAQMAGRLLPSER